MAQNLLYSLHLPISTTYRESSWTVLVCILLLATVLKVKPPQIWLNKIPEKRYSIANFRTLCDFAQLQERIVVYNVQSNQQSQAVQYIKVWYRRTAYLQNIHDDTKRPHITGLIVFLWTQYLWGYKKNMKHRINLVVSPKDMLLRYGKHLPFPEVSKPRSGILDWKKKMKS